jgi:hypothetical protein
MLNWPGRFIWWLYHDANAPGVVQAFAAIVTALVTAALMSITWRYVRLTAKLVKAGDDAIKATFVPDLQLEFGPDYNHEGVLFFSLKNVMQAPVAILRAEVTGDVRHITIGPPLVHGEPFRLKTIQVDKFRDAVLVSNAVLVHKMAFEPQRCDEAVWKNLITRYAAFTVVMVDCCDLTERVFFRFTFTQTTAIAKVSSEIQSLPADPRRKKGYYLTTPS